MLHHDVTPMDQDGASSGRRASSQSPKPGSKASVRPRKKKEENSLSVEDSNQGYPKISPDLPRKPPPKPKMSFSPKPSSLGVWIGQGRVSDSWGGRVT